MVESAEQLAGVAEGQILAGKFRVERVLGVGGMGAVVAAHHLQLDEKVALKFLLPVTLASQEAVTRFAQEARAAVKIKSDHVARVLDVGTLDNGAPYMVMEFLEGVDLATLLKRQGPLPIEQAVDFVLQACEAIAEAHSLGIVHRDLKPANLFCVRRADGREHIKVLDFGISKVTPLGGQAGNLGMTRTSALLGTPFYMSPEQLEASHAVDARADIWALGVVLFELVAGKVPFPGDSIGEISFKIACRPPLPLRELRPDTPEALERVILRCLQRDRDGRYKNVAELAAALLPFGRKRSSASVERISDIVHAARAGSETLAAPYSEEAAGPSVAGGTIAPFGRTAPWPSNRRKTGVGLVVVAALAAVSGIAFVARRSALSSAHQLAGSSSVPSSPTTAATPTPTANTVPVAVTVVPTPAREPPKEESPSTAPTHETESRAPVSGAVDQAPPRGAASGTKATVGGAEGVAASSRGVKRTAPVGAGRAPATTASPSRPDPAAAPASKKNDCDPNYEIDPASGAHKFKPWCFGKESK